MLKPSLSLFVLTGMLWTAFGAPGRPQDSPGPERRRAHLDIAEEYLHAYEAMDMQALSKFWTPESSWQDPTSAEIGASSDPVVGPEKISAHLLAATTGLSRLRFDLPKRFTSGGQVVCMGSFSYALSSPALGTPEAIHFEMDTVIILEIKAGKVLSHRDYADFSGWMARLNAGRR